VFFLALGENLWKRFLPKYMEALGAPVTAIGLFGSCQDLLDGLYQYPGGWIADRYGRRRALVLFVALATAGYLLYAPAPSWPLVFVGLVFVMAWSSMASPTLFAVLAHDFTTLVLAFVVGGLREIGEPARKALIVDLVQPWLRARSVGL
jgi:MFS family permease